jgi:anti-sigma-K factor RskA
MNEDDDIDGLAAEYVLGSLNPGERSRVNARCKTDATLADAIEAWQRRLGPLSSQLPGIAPPLHLFDRILIQIAGQDAQPQRRNLGRSRSLAAGAAAVAACVALIIAGYIYEHTSTTRGSEPQRAKASATTEWVSMSCGALYKDFWQKFDRKKFSEISAMQLAGASRMALRAYDACEAGDAQTPRRSSRG